MDPTANAETRVENEAELVALVQDCIRENKSFHCYGNGTKAHCGPSAPAGSRRISMAGVHTITLHDPGDLVVTAAAGTRVSALQQELGKRQQWLAIDPPHDDATIGGMLATGIAGPRRLAYGPVKDHVLGMRVLNPRGVVTRSGGQVVKNVTGFDLHKLQVGAFGSLGVIVETTFRVRALPEASAVFIIGFAGASAATKALLDVWRSPLQPTALLVLEGNESSDLGKHVADLPDAPALAVVGVEGSREMVSRHRQDISAALDRAAGAQGRAIHLEGDHAHAVWDGFRRAASTRRDRVVVRIGARPSDLLSVLAQGRLAQGRLAQGRLAQGRLAQGRDLTGTALQVATGVAHISLAGDTPADQVLALVKAYHLTARDCGGYAVVESAPTEMPGRKDLPWAPPQLDAVDATRARMFRHLKQSWDASDLFNPGRMAL